MNENVNLVFASAAIARRNKRYIVWFYLLNLAFAHFGASAFSDAAHNILDHSLYADKLLHGFNLGVFTELLTRPQDDRTVLRAGAPLREAPPAYSELDSCQGLRP